MNDAIAYKNQHPEMSYKAVADRYKVARSTLYDRHRGLHLSHQEGAARALSMIQEDVLIDRINAFANRGTLLTPGHVQALAEAVHGEKLGENWTSRFLARYRDRITSTFYTYRELGRMQADKPETRKAFYNLVSISEGGF